MMQREEKGEAHRSQLLNECDSVLLVERFSKIGKFGVLGGIESQKCRVAKTAHTCL